LSQPNGPFSPRGNPSVAVPAGISTLRAACNQPTARSFRRLKFAVHGQLVQHVAQRFGMHQAMFDGDFEQTPMFEARKR
jgi:hypothetical protein